MQIDSDEQFANDILHFAARRFKAPISETLTVMVERIPTQLRWFDFYLDVASRTHFASGEWGSPQSFTDFDGFSYVWNIIDTVYGNDQVVTLDLVKDVDKRRELAESQGLVEFDREMANRAIQHDGLIFLNQELIDIRIKTLSSNPEFCMKNHFRVEDYLKLLITHECINMIEDADNQNIIIMHNPHETFDKPTLQTFDAYTQESKK
jgi:hypothetical protein